MHKVAFELRDAIDHVQGVLNGVARRCADEGFQLDVRSCPETGNLRFVVAAVREVYAAGDLIQEQDDAQPER